MAEQSQHELIELRVEMDALDDDPRTILRRVAAYKELCDRVRRSATGGLIFGGLMLLIWYLMPQALKFRTFGLIYLGLAALEFTAALWNKFAPSAEGGACGRG